MLMNKSARFQNILYYELMIRMTSVKPSNARLLLGAKVICWQISLFIHSFIRSIIRQFIYLFTHLFISTVVLFFN